MNFHYPQEPINTTPNNFPLKPSVNSAFAVLLEVEFFSIILRRTEMIYIVLGPKLFFVTGLVIFLTAVAVVMPHQGEHNNA